MRVTEDGRPGGEQAEGRAAHGLADRIGLADHREHRGSAPGVEVAVEPRASAGAATARAASRSHIATIAGHRAGETAKA